MEEEKYETHLFSYRFEGHQWGFEIPAKDADEAKRRLSALTFAKHDGVLVARVNIPDAASPIVRAFLAVRNFFGPRP